MVNLKLVNLSKNYGKKIAVDCVSFESEGKEIICLLGADAAGKSTILSLVAGLETPTSGDVYINDKPVTNLPPKDRNVSMVFQSLALYPTMTVHDNLAFPLEIQKRSKTEIETKIMQVAGVLHIEHLLNRKPGQLSGGEKQRVAIGRALAKDPDVFLLDEPLTNLDAKLRIEMRKEIKKLRSLLGAVMLMATPDQFEAMTIADKIAVISEGKLLQFGTPEFIYDHPKNFFVAAAVGSPKMNLIKCRLTEKDKRLFLTATNFQLELPDPKSFLKAKNTDVILGIRPEDVSLNETKLNANSIPMEFLIIEHVRPESIVTLQMGEETVQAKVPPNFSYGRCEKIWVNFSLNKMHLFDEKTKEAL